jgi:hypothetical protein
MLTNRLSVFYIIPRKKIIPAKLRPRLTAAGADRLANLPQIVPAINKTANKNNDNPQYSDAEYHFLLAPSLSERQFAKTKYVGLTPPLRFKHSRQVVSS